MKRETKRVRYVLIMVIIVMSTALTLDAITGLFSPVQLFLICFVLWISALISVFYLLTKSLK